MWKISSLALFGAMTGLAYGMVVFPEYQNVFFHALTVTGGLFIITFSRSILDSK